MCGILSLSFDTKIFYGLFTSGTLFTFASLLLNYRMQFQSKKDFLNSENESFEPETIILTGAKYQTGVEEDEKEERYLRVSSLKNKLNKKIASIAFLIVAYILIFIVNRGEIGTMNSFVLVTSSLMILLAQSIGQLLMAPTLMVLLLGFISTDSLRPQFLSICFFLFYFCAWVSFTEFEKETFSLDLKFLKTILKAFATFCIFWIVFSHVIDKNDGFKKSLINSIEKLNKKADLKNQRSRISPGDLQMAIEAIGEMNKLWRSDQKMSLPEFSAFNQKFSEIKQISSSELESLSFKQEWNEIDIQNYHRALHQAREMKMALENLNISTSKISLPPAPEFMPPIDELTGLLPQSMKAKAILNNEEMLKQIKSFEFDTDKKNQLLNEIKSMQHQLETLDTNESVEKFLSKQARVSKEVQEIIGTKMDHFKDLERELMQQKEELLKSSNAEVLKYMQQNIPKNQIFKQIESSNILREKERSHYISEEVLKKNFDRFYQVVKTFMLFLGGFLLFKLFKGKAKQLHPEKEESKEIEKIFDLRRKYLSPEDEVRQLYRNFNLAIHLRQYNENEQVPPPKIMQIENAALFAKRLKSLHTVVELFSRCHYGDFKVSQKELLEFKKAYKRLRKQLV